VTGCGPPAEFGRTAPPRRLTSTAGPDHLQRGPTDIDTKRELLRRPLVTAPTARRRRSGRSCCSRITEPRCAATFPAVTNASVTGRAALVSHSRNRNWLGLEEPPSVFEPRAARSGPVGGSSPTRRRGTTLLVSRQENTSWTEAGPLRRPSAGLARTGPVDWRTRQPTKLRLERGQRGCQSLEEAFLSVIRQQHRSRGRLSPAVPTIAHTGRKSGAS